MKDDLRHYCRHLASQAQHTSLVWSRVYYCRNQVRKTRLWKFSLPKYFTLPTKIFYLTCQHTLAFTCSLFQMDLFPSNLRFCFFGSFFLFFHTGLEPYMVHRQSRPYPVFPEHSAGVGPLCLSVVAGSLLLPSSLLPWPWTHSDVWPLRRQNGETLAKLQPLWSFFIWKKKTV